MREFSVSWDGKELGVKLKRASEVAGGKLGSAAGGGPNGDGGAPPVITSVQVMGGEGRGEGGGGGGMEDNQGEKRAGWRY